MRYFDKYEPEHAWRNDAKCKGEDTELFFPPRDRNLYKPIADKAKGICWGTGGLDLACPVRNECLWDAIRMGDTHGIRGGLSHRERSHLGRWFDQNHPGESFKDFILSWNGNGKEKRFTQAVPRHQEGGDTPAGSDRASHDGEDTGYVAED